MQITFELSEEDLGFFREVMRKSRQRTDGLDESAVVENARQLLQRIARSETSDFIREHMSRLETLIAMLVDEAWGMEDEDRSRVLQALAYFSDPEDLVPDDVPGLGFLDDAIMIELVCRELRHELQAYRDFCADRAVEPGRLGQDAPEAERSVWLEERRQQLHSRMRRQRRQGKSGGGHSPFSLF